MTNLEMIEASELQYSPQSIGIITELKDNFDFEGFEVWVKENKFIVGGTYIIEFLHMKRAQQLAQEVPPMNGILPFTPESEQGEESDESGDESGNITP